MFSFFSVICGGCDILRKECGDEPSLIAAAHEGDVETVCALLESGTNVNCINNQGSSPLLLAALNGHFHVIDILIKQNANVNHLGPRLWTPLHAACYYGHIRSVCLLLFNGADIKTKNMDKKKPGTEFDSSVSMETRVTIKKLLDESTGITAVPSKYHVSEKMSSNQFEELLDALEIEPTSKCAEKQHYPQLSRHSEHNQTLSHSPQLSRCSEQFHRLSEQTQNAENDQFSNLPLEHLLPDGNFIRHNVEGDEVFCEQDLNFYEMTAINEGTTQPQHFLKKKESLDEINGGGGEDAFDETDAYIEMPRLVVINDAGPGSRAKVQDDPVLAMNEARVCTDYKTVTTQPLEVARPLINFVQVRTPTAVRESQWKDGLCDCSNNCMPSCCMSCWCPCVMTGQIREKLQIGSFSKTVAVGLCCGLPFSNYYAYKARGIIRQRFHISGSSCVDCFVVHFCTVCALSQMARHIYDYRKCNDGCIWTKQGEPVKEIAHVPVFACI